MKNKKIQIPIIVIACIIALAGVYKLLDSVCYPFVEAKAENYLCEKYDAQPEEFELVDYKRAKIYWDDYYIFFLTPKWTDFSFEFKYKDRNVIVNRDKGLFYDDYQIDDVEKWCTEWLQENVDKRIIGIQINSYNIMFYQINTNKSQYHILTENDVEKFISNCYYNDYYVHICCNNANISNLEYDSTEDDLLSIISGEIQKTDRLNIYFTDKVEMIRNTEKSDYSKKWYTEYIA